MRYIFVFAAALLAAMSFSGPAEAAHGYASTSLNVRAGPGGAYPLIGRIGPRTPLFIRGCTPGWRWCDVSAGSFRGWVAGSYIHAPYHNRNVNVVDFGAVLGLPVVTFQERTYWGRNYYDRDFYRTRYGWNGDHRHYGWRRGYDGRWVRDTDRDRIPDWRDSRPRRYSPYNE